MSLIEQAARRLEELRRAGAEVPEAATAAPAAPAAAADAPTPEALVRALDARAPEVAPQIPSHAAAAVSGRARVEPHLVPNDMPAGEDRRPSREAPPGDDDTSVPGAPPDEGRASVRRITLNLSQMR